MRKNIIRCVTIALLIFWMCVIFCFSAQPAVASDETSNEVVERIVEVFYPDYETLDDAEKQDLLNSFVNPVRKLAHFIEFAVLGVLAYFTFSVFEGVAFKYRYVFSLMLGVLYAISDEVHQIFVPGRACKVFDIFVDSSGVLLSVTVCFIFSSIKGRGKSE